MPQITIRFSGEKGYSNVLGGCDFFPMGFPMVLLCGSPSD